MRGLRTPQPIGSRWRLCARAHCRSCDRSHAPSAPCSLHKVRRRSVAERAMLWGDSASTAQAHLSSPCGPSRRRCNPGGQHRRRPLINSTRVRRAYRAATAAKGEPVNRSTKGPANAAGLMRARRDCDHGGFLCRDGHSCLRVCATIQASLHTGITHVMAQGTAGRLACSRPAVVSVPGRYSDRSPSPGPAGCPCAPRFAGCFPGLRRCQGRLAMSVRS